MTSDIPPLLKHPEGNTGVFWDVEDYPILGRLDSESLYQTIKEDLRRSRYSGDVSVHFFVPGPELVADFHPKFKSTVLPRGGEYVISREMSVHIQVWALLNPPPSNILMLSKKINSLTYHRYASLYEYHYGVVLSDPEPGWLLPITSSATFFSRRLILSHHKVYLSHPTTSSVPLEDWKWIRTWPKEPPVGVFLDLTDLHDDVKPGLLLNKILELVKKEGGGVFYVHAVCQEDMRKHVFSKYQFLVRGIPTKEEAVIWMLDATLFWTIKQAEPGQVRQPVKILLLSNIIQNDDHPNLALVRSCLEKLGCSLAWARPDTLLKD